MKPLHLLISFLFIVCFITVAYSEDVTPPKCIGDVCLFQHIDEIEKKVYGYGKEIFGPLAFLKNEGRFTSPGATMETMNWVLLTSCKSPGTIKTIHRVISDEKGAEFSRLLSEYESEYGAGENPGYTPQDQKLAQWAWKTPETVLALIWDSRLKIVSIDLYSKNYDDFKCLDQADLKKK